MSKQSRASNMRLVESVAEFGRTLIRRSKVVTSIVVTDVSDEAETDDPRPISLSVEALEEANQLSDVLHRVADLSGAEPSVLLIAAGKLLARYGATFGETPGIDDPDERGAENAVMTAAGGFVLGMEAFVRDIRQKEEDEAEEIEDYDDDDDDEENVEEDDSDYEELDPNADLDTTDAGVKSDYPSEDEEEDDELAAAEAAGAHAESDSKGGDDDADIPEESLDVSGHDDVEERPDVKARSDAAPRQPPIGMVHKL